MSRKTFLSIFSFLATAIGAIALAAPAALLASKGVAPGAAAQVWVRELGVALIALGVMAFLMRGQRDSPALRAFLIGNALLQIGLLPIEIVAAYGGVITKLSGVVPNSILHAVLAVGFIHFAAGVRPERSAH